jgi:hypothetical protein
MLIHSAKDKAETFETQISQQLQSTPKHSVPQVDPAETRLSELLRINLQTEPRIDT